MSAAYQKRVSARRPILPPSPVISAVSLNTSFLENFVIDDYERENERDDHVEFKLQLSNQAEAVGFISPSRCGAISNLAK